VEREQEKNELTIQSAFDGRCGNWQHAEQVKTDVLLWQRCA
jgi:hypothetical protein